MISLWVYYRGEFPTMIPRLVRPGKCFGSGTDLRSGESDVSYEFRTAKSARSAASRIKAALGRRVRVKVKDDGPEPILPRGATLADYFKAKRRKVRR
jgi:hypothetical protein